MEESDVHERERVLALHLGALYSRPAELSSSQSNNSTCGGTSFSARCFLPEELQRRASRGSEIDPADSALPAAEDASDSASGPVREVFCRVLPQPPVSPANRTAALKTGKRHDRHDAGSVDTLSEALGLMYEGVRVVYSPLPSTTGAAGPEAPEEGGAAEGKAERPPSSTLHLVPCPRLHAGLIPLFAPVVESADGIFLLFACLPFRLTALTQLCREVRGARGVRGRRSLHSVDLIVRFVFYQLLRAVDFLHSRGITVGNLGSSSILLTDHLWVQVAPSISLLLGDGHTQSRHREGSLRRPFVAAPRRPPGEDLPLTYRWVKGMVSNLEYLLAVNAAAGRVVGDRACHPIVPWVCDFSRKVTEDEEEEEDLGGAEKDQEGGGGKGWRDLTMTKFRLKKGDAQLDSSYSEGKPPHHVPESLSELTLAVYLARQLPLQVLQDVVRSKLVAEEYPKSLATMYSWTPDECIPEFYTEPGVFRSAHGGVTGLPDLDVPPWCDGSPEDFVRYHRSLLEGERVSRSLHRWLDITFGYCLKGQAAVDNKNVPLPPGGVSGMDVPAGSGAAGLKLSEKDRPAFVQIFRHPHPPRKLNAHTSASATDAASKPATLFSSPRVAATPTASRAGDDGLATKDSGGSTMSTGGGANGGGDGGARFEENEGAGGGEARASIFGVAFDDYIGEEGVLHPPAPAAAGGGGGSGGGGGGCGGGGRFDGNNGGGAGEACASIEEDRRALAFAHDVELRLNPWYGRPRTRVVDEPDLASPAAKNADIPLTDTTWRIGYEDNGTTVKPGGGRSEGNGDGDRERRQRRREIGASLSSKKKDDLLACGCVLAEMCAGEPVLVGPSSSSLEVPSGGGGKSSWLEAAAELPLALRRTIRALTHPDPEKRPSAHDLLSTTEPAQHAPSSKTSLPSWRASRFPAPPPPPAYRGLFPPYMRDVYAFLAAVHQEETAQKRLVLAAAALPVLQVPLHAFSLVVPYLVALLEAFSPKAKEADMRKKRNTSNSEGCATGTVDTNCAVLRKERGGVSTRPEGTKQRSDRLDGPTSTGLSTPLEPRPSIAQGESQSPRVMAAAVATKETRPYVPEDAQASTRAEASETEALEAAKHSAAWVSVFDLCAERLGPSLAAEVLLPSVVATLERVQSSELASHLMDSNIWGVIARRVGNEWFLRHVFPLLLGWLEQGVGMETDICVGNDRHQCCVVQSALGQPDDAEIEQETQQATVVSPRSGTPSAAGRMSGKVEQAEQPSPGGIDGFDERGSRGLTAASRVQVAAAASVSKEIFGRLGPTLAARYLVPALVDCLGRLVTTAAAKAAATSATTSTAAHHTKHSKACPTTWRRVSDSTSTAPSPPPAATQGSELNTSNDDGGIDGAAAPLHPPRLVGATAELRRPISREFCGGDPVSVALLRYCQTRGAIEDHPDVGVGDGTSFLVLSRALGEMCLQIGTEEVTVPLVLSRLFHQILPSLAPVLTQRGGASATATGFRSVLEVTSLLNRLLPTLCPETISHFYVGMRPPASCAEAETTCSVPWLFLAMPLPPPVVGLDVPYSADQGEPSGDDSQASTEELERSSNRSTSSGKQEDSLGGSAIGNEGVAVGDGSVRFVCQVEAARLLATTAMGVLGEGGGGSEEEKEGKEECARVLQAGEAFFSTFERSYCGLALSSSTMVAALKLARELHSPLASLFGFDIMHRCVPSASGSTVAWLTEGAVCARRQPATIIAPAPREGFDDLGAEESSAGVILGERSGGEGGQDEEDRTAHLRSSNWSGAGSGAPLVSSWKPLRNANPRTAGSGETGADTSTFRLHENSQENMIEPRRHITLSPEDGIYISPPASPENFEQHLHNREGFGGSTAAETVSGRAEGAPRPSATQAPLLNRVRQVLKHHSVAEDGGAPPSTSARIAGWLQPGRQAARTAATTLSYFSSRADRDQQPSQVSRTKEEGGRGTRSSAAEKVELEIDGGRASHDTRGSPSLGGVPAWGHRSDKRDPLLAFPSSTLPPSSSRRNRGDGVIGDRARAPDRCAEQQSPQLPGAEWPEHRRGRSRSLGAAPPETAVEGEKEGDDSEPEEWPSLLGAIGSKTPSAPDPALPSLAVRALSSPFSRAVPAPTAAATSFSLQADERVDFAASALLRRETAEAAATAVTSATKPGSQALSTSPRRLSPFFIRGNNTALPPPQPPPPLPLPPPALGDHVSSGPPPPLPGTCRGVGVEVRARLRDRAMFTGTREWGESGRIPGRRRGHALGEGFEPDAVGSLFPLSMALQTSFLAHPSKAAVTSMAVEKHSESILLTGSAEGEVRVWSLRQHPVSRLSGFHSGGSGAGGGGGGAARSSTHAAVTQLGFCEGAGRAAALDGLIRIWDVERSKGLAICHQGAQRDAPSLTAFSFSGCGDGTTPPLDESEWKELPFGASGSFSAPDDQQVTASYGGGIVHFDCRQGRLRDSVGDLFPVAQWDVDARLQSLLAHPSSKGQTRGDAHGSSSRRHGDAAPLPVGLCSVCEGEGAWLAAGSGAGQVVVFDKRRPGGRPLFWWNAHGGAVVGVFHVARDLLLTMSRDRTAVLWDLSHSRSDFSGIDSTGAGPAPRRHPSWGAGAYTSEEGAEFLSLSGGGAGGGGESGYGELSPARVSTTFGLPNTAPGLCPATVVMLPLSRPPPAAKRPPGTGFEQETARSGGSAAAEAAGVSMFGEGFSTRGDGGRTTARTEQAGKLPVLFAASGDRMVAGVVRRDLGGRQRGGNGEEEEELEEVHPVRFVGPSGKTVDGKKGGGGMRSASGGGALVVRSVAMLPLRRLSLLGCADGWVRVGT